MKRINACTITLLTVALILTIAAPGARAAGVTLDDPPSGVTVTIYPVLVKAPIMGASIDLPPIPGGGGGSGGSGGSGSSESGDVTGSTGSGSLNSAFLAGFKIEARRWFAEANGVYAGLSGSRSAPKVTIDAKTTFGNGRVGVGLGKGFFATGGFRWVQVNLDATLTLPDLGRTIEGRTKPRLWDPMIGVDWRGRVSSKWSIDTNFQGGGFGVGTDVDLSGEFNASRHFGNHFDLRFGWDVLHYKMTLADVGIGAYQRTLVSTQTLNGPSFGFGIVF